MRSIARHLEAHGFATFAPSYPSFRRPLDALVAALAPRIEQFAERSPGPLHFVTHSLGGLIAARLLGQHRFPELGRVVMLAPPHQGSQLADLLFRLRIGRLALGPVGKHLTTIGGPATAALRRNVDYPLGIIAGTRPLDPIFPRLLIPGRSDGKVAVAATRIDGMADHITLPVSHTLMVSDRRVITATLRFIESGSFAD